MSKFFTFVAAGMIGYVGYGIFSRPARERSRIDLASKFGLLCDGKRVFVTEEQARDLLRVR